MTSTLTEVHLLASEAYERIAGNIVTLVCVHVASAGEEGLSAETQESSPSITNYFSALT